MRDVNCLHLTVSAEEASDQLCGVKAQLVNAADDEGRARVLPRQRLQLRLHCAKPNLSADPDRSGGDASPRFWEANLFVISTTATWSAVANRTPVVGLLLLKVLLHPADAVQSCVAIIQICPRKLGALHRLLPLLHRASCHCRSLRLGQIFRQLLLKGRHRQRHLEVVERVAQLLRCSPRALLVLPCLLLLLAVIRHGDALVSVGSALGGSRTAIAPHNPRGHGLLQRVLLPLDRGSCVALLLVPPLLPEVHCIQRMVVQDLLCLCHQLMLHLLNQPQLLTELLCPCLATTLRLSVQLPQLKQSLLQKLHGVGYLEARRLHQLQCCSRREFLPLRGHLQRAALQHLFQLCVFPQLLLQELLMQQLHLELVLAQLHANHALPWYPCPRTA
mmetsp:Transcript_118991/g.331984  ORF Transcript_118991/g.331984 Transcript_118991/m.331984 type:complete len:389 (+) Transcript_118991:528-1694(+)